MTSGLFNIDGDLKYLYGQLPQRITEAAEAVMVKKIRKTVYNISRAVINIAGFLMTWDLCCLLGEFSDNKIILSVHCRADTVNHRNKYDCFGAIIHIWTLCQKLSCNSFTIWIISRDLHNVLFRSGLSLFQGFTDTDTTTPSTAVLIGSTGDFLQAFSFWYGVLVGWVSGLIGLRVP